VNGRKGWAIAFLPVFALGILLMLARPAAAESQFAEPLVYDFAELLTEEEEAELAELAAKSGAKRETDFIIIALNGTGGMDIEEYVARFYDDTAPGYDGPHGNAAILAIDLKERDVFLAGFGKAETYLDAGRLDKIRAKITPHLSDGEYDEAFRKFIRLAHAYMGYRPGVNPDNILFRDWFQIAVALVVGAVTVGIMASNAGGRVTVNARTYLDEKRSGVVGRHDRFVNKTVTRRKIEKSSSGGGGGGGFGGGGGITPGGRSFSSSRGKF
jgi:uncharacterized protein